MQISSLINIIGCLTSKGALQSAKWGKVTQAPWNVTKTTHHMFCKMLCIFSLSLLMGGCAEDASPISREEIPGVYIGAYFEGIETVAIKEDGTFSQKFRKRGAIVYQAEGKWEITEDGVIIFSPFMSPAGAWSAKFDEEPQTSQTTSGQWGQAPFRIVFSEDQGYWLLKNKTPEPTH